MKKGIEELSEERYVIIKDKQSDETGSESRMTTKKWLSGSGKNSERKGNNLLLFFRLKHWQNNKQTQRGDQRVAKCEGNCTGRRQ